MSIQTTPKLDPAKSYKKLYTETMGKKYGLAPWPLGEAKQNFDEMLKTALAKGPQTITRRGKEVAVLIRYEDYQKLNNLATTGRATPFEFDENFFASAPKFDFNN